MVRAAGAVFSTVDGKGLWRGDCSQGFEGHAEETQAEQKKV